MHCQLCTWPGPYLELKSKSGRIHREQFMRTIGDVLIWQKWRLENGCISFLTKEDANNVSEILCFIGQVSSFLSCRVDHGSQVPEGRRQIEPRFIRTCSEVGDRESALPRTSTFVTGPSRYFFSNVRWSSVKQFFLFHFSCSFFASSNIWGELIRIKIRNKEE